jgi:ABC-type branched-subunit amino acid transport system permease subunit
MSAHSIPAASRRQGISWGQILTWVILAVVVATLPLLFPNRYLVNAFINMVMWIIFALSFDLSAGHVGAVSLGHAVFFGVGAYVTAIAAPALGLGFISATLLSAVSMALLAFVAGIAFFRIAEVSFAIGTLGALIMMQIIANNSYELTGGPMCTQNVPRPAFDLPFMAETFVVRDTTHYYYLLLPLLAVTLLVYRLVTTSRIGRAFAAVRQDEVRASALGIHPRSYKLLAFVIGAFLIGALGSFQAQYVTVVCPSELALTYTLNLLIIVFVGGAGRMRGVILGAVLFTLLPRGLETFGGGQIPPAYQQVAYGVILLLVIRFLPDGLDSLLERAGNALNKAVRGGRHAGE